jgi:hypothetical protein
VEVPRADAGTAYNRGFAGMIGMLGNIPRQLPYEKMRQSTNVQDFGRAQPPPQSIADLLAGRFTPNAEYEERMQRGVPLDALNSAVGLRDLMQLTARRR